jgi:hypothetical protein
MITPPLRLLALIVIACSGAHFGVAQTAKQDEEAVAAMRRAFREPYHYDHQKAVMAQLDKLTPSAAPGVFALFEEFGREGIRRDFAWNTFWMRWGQIDGPNAAETALKAAVAGRWHFEAMIDGWTQTNPAAAEAWVRAHPDTPHYGYTFAALIGALARKNPEQATAAVFSLAQRKDQLDGALGNLCETLRVSGGTARVAAWFETLNDTGKQLAMNHAAWRIKDGDVKAAAQWFAAQADKPWRDDKHLYDFINRYVDEDSTAALDWLITVPLPAGASAPAGLATAVRKWTTYRSPLTAFWLKAHEDAAWWPRAAAAHVAELRKRNNADADNFLGSLDATRRAAVEAESAAK